jgi:two-component system chemotaxis sensor kinase CheA
MELSGYTELFLAEAREHISAMNRFLLQLEKEPDDRAAIDELFRAVHTLKGTAAAMEYMGVSGMAHALEHTLDGVRAGRAEVDADLIDRMLEAADSLERELERQAGGGAAQPVAVKRPLRAEVTIAGDAPFPAVRALLVLRAARTVGEVTAAEPPEERITAGECGRELALVIETASTEAEVAATLATAGELERVEVSESSAPKAARAVDGEGPVVRVAQARLEKLVDYIGELVFARDRLQQVAHPEAGSELESVFTELSQLVGRIRDEAIHLRRVPAAELFDRLPRVVRDASRTLGKEVELELAGRDTPLDRSVLREAGDLLVHLLRNAVDHGIESAEEREAAGKPRNGRVKLSAELDRSAVVIRVVDDGGGLRRERILRVAVERGLLTEAEAATLPDSAVLRLITRPGFSTAARVTDVSGRGVGLDVVHSRVQELGGTMVVESEPGVGTTFILRLPLTLSIVRVLQVETGGETYAIPTAAVEEVGEVGEGSDPSGVGEDATELRGEALPLLRLPALLDAPERGSPPVPTPMVVVSAGGRRFGVLVDALLGQSDAVVKHFDAPLRTAPVFAGVTLLSDGRPALILDPERLASFAETVPAGADGDS